MKPFFILCLLCLFSFSEYASAQKQAGSVSGNVVDSAGKAVAFATVTLMKKNTLQPFQNTFSDERGAFRFSNVPFGTYKLAVTMIGYAPASKDSFVLDAAHNQAALGKISLQGSTHQLQTVTVASQKPLLEVKDDKIVYNVENDLMASTETADEVLRKVPMVTVDLDGTIKLRGKENFKVLENGKNTGFIAKSPKDALQNFPANLIKSIEIITEPSAKYDAEGTAGIINIITVKKFKGYNANVGASYNSIGQMNLNTSLNMKVSRLGIAGYYGLGHSQNKGHSVFSRENLIPGFHSFLDQTSQNKNKNTYQYGNLELSYDLDSTSSLSLYGNLWGGSFGGDGTTDVITSDSMKNVQQTGHYISHSSNSNYSYSVGMDYQKSFKTEEQKLITSILLDRNTGHSNSDNKQYYDPGANKFYKNLNDNSNNESTVKVDYTQPFKHDQELEAGVKGILRKLGSDYENNVMDTVSGKYVINPAQSNVFNYQQNVYSVYGTYRFKFRDYSLKLGARLENTDIHGDFQSTQTTIDQNYTNLIPTLSLSRQYKKVHNFRFSYSRRLERPGIWYLNPYVNNDDPKNIRHGNPNLDPEFTNSLSLDYNGFLKGKSINLSLYYNYTNNSIQSLTTVDSTTGVATTSYYNIGKDNVAGLNIYTSTQITPKWMINFNANVNYVYVKSNNGEGLRNDGFSGNGYISTNYSFTEGFRAEINGFFYTGSPSLQGRYSGSYNLSVGLRKELFKRKAALTLALESPFRTNRQWKGTFQDPTFIQHSSSYYPARALRIGFNWHFGKLKESVSRKTGINNDDVKSGGSSNGGGGQ